MKVSIITSTISEKVCSRCKKETIIGDFYIRNDRPSGYTSACKKCLTKDGIERNLKRKINVFNQYGGCFCKCCGEQQVEFLSIDHINNDGGLERKNIKQTKYIYCWLTKNKFPDHDRYQVLCANCQQGKRLNNGICPHQN